MKIDSHQHFWHYCEVKHSWINDQMSAIKKNFLPSDLQWELSDKGIDGCVAVQADQHESETNFLVAESKKHDFIKGVVGWVDLRAKNIERRLAHYTKEKIIKGFRHVVQDEPHVDFMMWSNFQNGIGKLEKYNFTYDILIYPSQLHAALYTVDKHPNQKFVIDHIAKPNIKEGQMEDWKKGMKEIAAHENVSCKLSGMVTEADWKDWNQEDFVPYLDNVMELFGVDRVMYGSDWPVSLIEWTYGEVKGIIDTYTENFSAHEKEKIYGKNAIDFYNL
ncbi:amidohydrolase family protein [Aquimarina agarivorans]|uniref:amidohydrolase family protein n=1 Tax=Aquimarina agarivorans TaxID=980584 RepID=UPI000497C38D|nr:amidohydrolase family protein [Aquimarina agarivorans]